MGFARIKIGTEPGEGELVFFPNQLNPILNLDESGIILYVAVDHRQDLVLQTSWSPVDVKEQTRVARVSLL